MLSLVITSYNRFDLLQRTIESLFEFNKYVYDAIFIIDDSGDKLMHEKLKEYCKDTIIILILNEQNIGAYESIDKVYSMVKSKYVLHVEDDWEFYKGGFIEPALKVLESDPQIMQVNLSNEQNMPIEPERYYADGVIYQLEGISKDGFWEGFTCNPSIRSMAGYEKTKPWTQWSTKEDFLALREMKVGKAYSRLGYRAAVLTEYFCKHIGIGRCTWHPNE